MVSNMLTAAAVTMAVFGGTLTLLAALFRAQSRRFDHVVAIDVLDEWVARRGPDRLATPPAEVVAAMVALRR